MSDKSGIPFSFWIVALAALIWNGLGAANYISQLSAENVANLPESYRTLIESRPAWATAGFATSVFGGVIAALAMLLRRNWAVPLLALSFIGTIVVVVDTIPKISTANLTGAEVVLIVVMPVFVGLLLWLYARLCAARGWLR